MKLMRSLWIGAALLTLAMAGRAEAAPKQTVGEWTVFFAPYIWLGEMHGDASIGDKTAPIDVGFDKIFDLMGDGNLFGGSGHLEAQKDNFSVFVDALGMYAKPDGSGPRGGRAKLQSSLVFLEWAVLYRVLELPVGETRKLGFEPMAGGRWLWNRNQIEVDTPGNAAIPPQSFDGDADKDVIDPFVGARISLDLTKELAWSFRGDAGGFGVGSDLSWQIASVFVYELGWKPFDLTLDAAAGYRLFDFHNEDGNKEINLQMRGPLLGMAVYF